jgi:hypothetical protein
MKRRFILGLSILGMTLSALAFLGSQPQVNDDACPLRGTPACPEYPSCSK